MGDLHDELDVPGPRPRAPAPNRPAAPAVDVARAIDSGPPGNASMLELQRLAGNASVSRLVAREPAVPSEPDEETASAGHSPVLDVVGRGGGEPLAPDLRAEMEGRLGADFGSVRVHRDATASESAKAVDAHAYTVGTDVVFRADRWDPASSDGKHTLAHELSHVVQQANGPVDGTPAPGGIRVSSPTDEFEQAADRSADAALAGPSPAGRAADAGAGAATAGPSAQLEAAPGEEELEDEETAQGEFVQREAATPDEEELEEEEEKKKTAQGEFVQREGEDEIGEDDDVEPPPPKPKGGPDGELEEESMSG
ncbi:MAG TPA: DUF4157 domain-containing protein [Verrucomicrobiae bacterium]|jgi:hypothetical protein|nr:DUF4157 domain-containing protein [Verrucomicrobiae bacterium]